MRKKGRISGLRWTFLKLNFLPVFLFTLIVTSFASSSFAASMRREMESELRDLNDAVAVVFDMMYPGDYTVVGEGDELLFYKGDHLINGDYSVIDAVKEKAGVDITLTYKSTRVITTLTDANGNRMTGTTVNNVITREVTDNREGHFYPKVSISREDYFAYYAPLINSDGTCIGMLFVAKPAKEVNKLVWRSVFPILLAALAVAVLTVLIVTVFSDKFLSTLIKIESLLNKTSNGNLTAELEPEVLKREDELGDMGRYVVQMQRSLRDLIERDQLTGLYNRRYVQMKLEHVQKKSLETGVPFSVAIGDIDFFKRVNDTYGHECGDAVLVDVSARMTEMMKGRGFVARWGGEEFLLVFESYRLDMAADCLEDLLKILRSRTVAFQNEKVKVTMTFGVVEGSDDLLDHIIADADKKLYYGKNNGRNQVVQ